MDREVETKIDLKALDIVGHLPLVELVDQVVLKECTRSLERDMHERLRDTHIYKRERLTQRERER